MRSPARRGITRHPVFTGRLGLASVILSSLVSIAAGAEDRAPGNARSLLDLSIDELMNVRVTTVSREESTIGESAAAVSVITPEMIRRSGPTEIPELLRMVPGLDVARIDGNKWAVASRGFNSRFAKNLLVQVDGRTVYSPQTSGVFWDAVRYPLEEIERIEVIRGPGASVWGANAVNGIINIITKPAKDTQGGRVTLGGGSVDQAFADLRYGGKIGDHLAYRVFGLWGEHARQFSLEGNTNDQWREFHTGLRLDWTPNERDTITLDGGYGRSVTGTKDRFARIIGPPFSPNVEENDTTDVGHVLARWRLYCAYTLLKMNLHRDAGLPASAEVLEKQSPQQQVFVQSSLNLPGNVEFDLTGRYVDRVGGFNPSGFTGVSDTVDAYVSPDARLAWRSRDNVEIGVVGQNLLDSHHPESGANPFIRSPAVEIRRAVFLSVGINC